MKMEIMSTEGFGGEALYIVVIAWLSIVSWIIFTFVDEADKPRKRRRSARGRPVFIGAAGFCDGTGSECDRSYGVCTTCS
ncbi:hypothetical protein Cni_G00708 [Canna indica]|uniref:Transmembrane protein n=1 Tax=Canna indica TaxID=4628 RepID=A0AAQ3Q0U9_9LILI|nr:hypothetical protein Cni_G00708 [Canna indica]